MRVVNSYLNQRVRERGESTRGKRRGPAVNDILPVKR